MYNLVYINTHDTGRMISPYGYDIPTPHLQELAKEGTLFTHAYCCSPTCSPSRASMLTGTYPHQNGMLGLAQRGFSLNDPSKHLAYYLRTNGYETAISGIQHEVGWYLDIDTNALHSMGYEDILTNSSEGYKKEELHLWDHKNAVSAADWIVHYNSDKPFMLSYGMHSTHRPYPVKVAENIDERYVKPPFPVESNLDDRHDQAQFMTSAQYADENANVIIDALKRSGLLENTIILFTTDHGVALPFNKCNLTDSGIGISMIIRHPEIARGKVVDQLVSQIDVFPTICDLLGLEKPNYLEGTSFLPTIERDEAVRDEVFAEVNFHTSYEPMRCVRNRRYKYIRYYDQSWDQINLSNIDESAPKTLLLSNGLKGRKKNMEALYDCLYDPDETNNLIGYPEYADVIDELKCDLQKHLEDTDDPILNGELEFKPEYKVNQKTCLQASSKNPKDYDPRGRGV